MMNWLNNLLDNDDVRNGFRTSVIGLIILAIPMIGFLSYADGFFEALWKVEIGLLGALAVIDGRIAKMEVKRMAYEHEYKVNTELQDTDKELFELNKGITDYTLAARYVRNYNKEQQERKDNLKTEIAINKLKTKIGILTLKDTKFSRKQVAKLQKKLDKLEKFPLKDKTYRPVKVSKMLRVNELDSDGSLDGANKYEYNYRGEVWWKTLVLTVLKFSGFGGAAGLPLALGMGWQVIVAYYAALIVGLLISSVMLYPKIRRRVAGPLLKTRINKVAFLKEMDKWIKDEIKRVEDAAKQAELEARKLEREKKLEEERLAKEKEANLAAIQAGGVSTTPENLEDYKLTQ